MRENGVKWDDALVEGMAAALRLTLPQVVSEYFPSFPHEPISYLPLKFSKESCKRLKEEKWGATYSELRGEYLFSPNKDKFLKQLKEICPRLPSFPF